MTKADTLVSVAMCLNAKGGAGRIDGESETFVPVAQAVADTLTVGANQMTGFPSGDVVAHALRAEGLDASEDGTGRGTPLVPVAFDTTAQTITAGYYYDFNDEKKAASHLVGHNASLSPICFDARQSDTVIYGERAGPLDTDGHSQAIAFSCKDNGRDATTGAAPTLRSMGHSDSHANGGGQLAVATGWAVRRLTPRECERLQGFPDDYTLVPTMRGVMADGPRYKMLGNSMACNVMRWIGRRIEAVEAIPSTEMLEAAE